MSSQSNYGSLNVGPSTSISPTELVSKRVLLERESIYKNLGLIKKNTQKLEKIKKALGTRKSNQNNEDLRRKMHEIQQFTNNIIKELSGSIGTFIKLSSSDKSQKIQTERLVADFNLVVQNHLKAEKQLSSKFQNTLLINLNDDDEQSSEQYQTQLQIQQENLTFENELLSERERNVKQIEVDVIDINKIMSEISTLVNEQSENIETIENTITHVSTDITSGTEELRKAASYQQKYRKKVIIILIICLIIALIITFSIYSKS